MTLVHYLREDRLLFLADTAKQLGMTQDQELRDEKVRSWPGDRTRDS